MSQDLSEFYRLLQVNMQNYLYSAIEVTGKEVGKVDATLGDLAFCFGSSFASIIFELTRDEDLKMTEEQKDLVLSLLKPFTDGLQSKTDLLVNPNPDKMEVVFE